MTIYVVLSESGKQIVRGVNSHGELSWTKQIERGMPWSFARDAYKWAADFKELEWGRVVSWESRRLDPFRGFDNDEAA